MKKKTPKPHPVNIRHLCADGTEIEAAVQAAVREARLQHKRAGNPICECHNGKVVWIQPKDIKP